MKIVIQHRGHIVHELQHRVGALSYYSNSNTKEKTSEKNTVVDSFEDTEREARQGSDAQKINKVNNK